MLPNKLTFNKYKHFLSLAVFLLLLLWFNYLEKTTTAKYIIYNKFDSYLPFIKEFVVPYCLWYLYVGVGVVYIGFISKNDFYKLYLFLFLGMSAAYAIYMIFPNAQYLRPTIKEKDIFSILIKNIYAFDTPTNVCPSVHVTNTIGIHLALINSDRLKDNFIAKAASLLIAVSICASTVFIKQHSIVDVAAGIVLSAVLYFFIYKTPKVTHHFSKLNIDKSLQKQT